ncbi:alanine racemase [Motilibacter peucedani]|uniref:Alanine racemase n=2 Tax=Motilibacter peucedani TaxID=598650 RepID=A0A420XU90_9ACTN|nr:alanine racemase [Motilibacter peucedani]
MLTVDLGAVAHNTRVLAAATPATLMAVVKGDGFGAGATAVARTALANGAGRLGVATVAEAVALRRAGLLAPVLSWLNPVDADFGPALALGVEIAVPSTEHLAAVAAAAGRGRARIHLHVDVGMARDGAPPRRWADLCLAATRAERAGNVEVVGVMGHLGWADTPGDTLNLRARRRFEEAVAVARLAGLRPHWRHLAATAATLHLPALHYDLCRVGAGLVGIDPAGRTPLEPAATLTAPVVSVRDVPAGTYVGYGRNWLTQRRTRLALLPVGYADGLPRTASGRAEVLLRGRRRPVAGMVSMDSVVVDVGNDPVAPGEVATVFGPGHRGEPTAEEWAGWAGTLAHEIVSGVGPRVVRRTVEAASLAAVGS